MNEAARPAAEADIGRIADLARGAIAELAPTRGGSVWRVREARREPMETALALLLRDGEAMVLTGTIDDVVMGYCVARVEAVEGDRLLGVIDDIYVEEGARGVGLGEAMIDQVIEWCRSRGCIGIDATALPGHRVTKNFFEGAGFTARKLIMHKQLDDWPRENP